MAGLAPFHVIGGDVVRKAFDLGDGRTIEVGRGIDDIDVLHVFPQLAQQLFLIED